MLLAAMIWAFQVGVETTQPVQSTGGSGGSNIETIVAIIIAITTVLGTVVAGITKRIYFPPTVEALEKRIVDLVAQRDAEREAREKLMAFIHDQVMPTLAKSNETSGALAAHLGEWITEVREWRRGRPL